MTGSLHIWFFLLAGSSGTQRVYLRAVSRLELVVDPWIKDLWVALEKEFLTRAENEKLIGELKDVNNKNPDIMKVPGNLDIDIETISLHSELPLSYTSLQKAESNTCKEDVEHSLVHSVPPLCDCSLNIPSLSPLHLDVQIFDCITKEIDINLMYPEDEIFMVPIRQAKRLTTEDAVKTTLMLELDISVNITVLQLLRLTLMLRRVDHVLLI
ncbi:unnamed protein product [Ranitomeya imitator]|uniref:Uncharacterized protein n=1 Tax=Ranitomeya imitator TaxID=111125 RepID=A0ABN9LEL0_9NEOB|nr:unnamed protein product [Ranitomeya imitator]